MSEGATATGESEHAERPGAERTAVRAGRWGLVFATVVLLAHFPLLLLHFWNLWQFRPHYQTFPLLLLGVAWLIWRRRLRFSGSARPSWWSTILLVSGLLTLSVGMAFFSPWLVAVATLFSIGGLIGRYADARQVRDWMAVWAAMWLIVPPPLNWEVRLFSRFQASTVQMASRLLDVWGVRHLLEGDVLVLPGHRIPLDQSWWVVNAPLMLVIFTVLYVVMARRFFLWSLLLLAGALACVWLADVLRIVTDAFGRVGWFPTEPAAIWWHDLLGPASVLVAVVLLASTDRFLAFLFRPIAEKKGQIPLQIDVENNPWVPAWNWLTSRSQRAVSRRRSRRTQDEKRKCKTDTSIRNRLSPRLYQLWRVPGYFFRFASSWWTTRDRSSLCWSLPALAAAWCVWAIVLLYGYVPAGEWLRIYEENGLLAQDQGDLQAADVYFRRMIQLDESSPVGLYRLALLAEQQDDVGRTRELLSRIAPKNRAGYPDAHFWLAKDRIGHRESVSQPPWPQEVEDHLRRSLRGQVNWAESRVLLAQHYAAGGQLNKAIAELERVVGERPELQLDLARLYRLAGQAAEARRLAAHAADWFESRARREPDQALHRLGWAASYVQQERYEDAIPLLVEGLSTPEPQPFQQALATTHLEWAATLHAQGELSPQQGIEFLEQVLLLDPDNQQALWITADLAMTDQESSAGATDLLKQILTRESVPGVVFLVMGTRLLERERFELGLEYLERSRKRNPNCAETLNNLAWGWAHRNHPDLQKALKFAQAAQQLSQPGTSLYAETHDTLGTVLMKLGRPREALVQFETSLRLLPRRAEVHRKLADVYQQLDNPDLAAEHQRLAELLEAATEGGSRN